MTEDALGSVRVTTNSFGEVKARRDFLPFGEELYVGLAGRNANQKYSSSTDDTRKKFATYQRDSETGLDFAQSRYYSPMHGRFTSPDEFKGGPDELFDFEEDASDNPTFYADLTNPQSLNKYQYGYNNPYKYNDPDGHCPTVLGRLLCHPAVVDKINRATDAIIKSGAAVAVGAALEAAVSTVDSHVRRRGGIDPDNTAAGRYARAVEGGQPQAWQVQRPTANGKQATPAKPSTGSTTASPPPSEPSGGKKSPNNNNKNRGGRGRLKTGADKLNQLNEIRKAQQGLRNGKGKGKIIIDSVKKSEQRVDAANKKLRNLKDAVKEYEQ